MHGWQHVLQTYPEIAASPALGIGSIAGGALVSAGVSMATAVALLYSLELPDSDETGGVRSAGPAFERPAPVAFNRRVGSVLVAVEYRIAPERAPELLAMTRALRALRLRNGGGRWGLFRDVENDMLWHEVFVDSWLQHPRRIDRMTMADKVLLDRVASLQAGAGAPMVRRGVSYEALRRRARHSERE